MMTRQLSRNFLLSSAGFFLLALLIAVPFGVVRGQSTASDSPAPSTLPAHDEEAQAAARERALEIGREVARREAALDELRYAAGVYAPELQEAYADLGRYLTEVEDFESARETYVGALQIARINTGLFSAEQLPLINAAIGANQALEDWTALDDLQVLHLHISERLFAPSDAQFIAAARQYGTWRLRVLRENLLDATYRGLALTAEELSEFYGAVIAQLETQNDVAVSDKLALILAKSETDLALVRALATTPYTEFPGTASPYVFKTRCQNVRDSRGQVTQRCTNIQVSNPRYVQSQRDAKQVAVNRQARAITEAMERLTTLRDTADRLSVEERQDIDSHIAQLDVETQQLMRRARSRRLF